MTEVSRVEEGRGAVLALIFVYIKILVNRQGGQGISFVLSLGRVSSHRHVRK